MADLDIIVPDERRKHKRFSDRSFNSATIEMQPVPPLYGLPATGQLVDLSGGGMAFVAHELIPKNQLMRMTLVLNGIVRIESVVRILRTKRWDDHRFFHGIQFLDASPGDEAAIEGMVRKNAPASAPSTEENDLSIVRLREEFERMKKRYAA